jgi:hypothetical protein
MQIFIVQWNCTRPLEHGVPERRYSNDSSRRSASAARRSVTAAFGWMTRMNFTAASAEAARIRNVETRELDGPPDLHDAGQHGATGKVA